jgi:predicted phage terminase large subunit-like protein
MTAAPNSARRVALEPSVSPQAAAAELARRDLRHFIIQAWPYVEPDVELRWNWHLDALVSHLERVSSGEIRRLIINVPPATSKSLVVSVFWPAWEWAREGGLRILAASYGSHLSIRDNMRFRSIINSPWYRERFDLRLSGDQRSKTRMETSTGGWRLGTSVGGVGTGEHPDRIIIDDPQTEAQSRSATERESTHTWFDRTVSTRGKTRGARVVVIAQRLHQEDLPGHLLTRGGWDHLCLPMRYEPGHPGAWPDDPRTEPGELLWPDLYTDPAVVEMELDLGPYGAASQLQQRPAPEGGGLFRREWFEVVEAAPAIARRCRGWDTAGTEGGGDWTVGSRLAVTDDGAIYVEDVVRDQIGPGAVEQLITLTARIDGQGVMIREEQEGGSAGKAVIKARSHLLQAYDYAGVSISGDKVTRARPFRAQCEAGNVRLVSGSWNEEYLRELTVFPAGKHDDQVDSTSAAYNALVDAPRPVRLREIALG